MDSNTLYQQARANFNGSYGTATHTLADGSTLYCSLSRVAGRSVVSRHLRQEWNHKPATEQYSKRISRARALELLT